MKMLRPAFLLLILGPASALAGMPSYRLTDVAKLRIEELSFFLVVLLLCSLGIMALWNLLAHDFPKLPRLRYRRALALTTLLGLFALLILSMISGAREILTPGAWRRQGSTHRLTDAANEPLRRKGVETLRAALWKYSAAHDGKFPEQDFAPELPEEIWMAPDEGRSRYIYVGGLKRWTADERLIKTHRILVAEPDVFSEPRFVLLSTGTIEQMTTEEIRRRMGKNSTP